MARKKAKTSATKTETVADARRRAIHSSWCKRNPQAAADERGIRLHLREMQDRWGHKQGTAPTHHAAHNKREGVLARLYVSGLISIEELGAAEEISAAAELMGADVRVRTMSLETRIDHGHRGDGVFWESLGQVRREMAYRHWYHGLGRTAGAIEDIILHDVGLVETAARHRIGVRRLRKLLIDALDDWTSHIRGMTKSIDARILASMHVGLT